MGNSTKAAMLQRVEQLEATMNQSPLAAGPQNSGESDLLFERLKERQSVLELKLDNEFSRIEKQQGKWIGGLHQQVAALKTLVETGGTALERGPIQATGTEIKAKQSPAVASKEIVWVVNLASLSSKKQAIKIQREFKKKGVDADIIDVELNGKQRYRLSMGGFSSKKTAMIYRRKLAGKLGLKDVWVGKSDS